MKIYKYKLVVKEFTDVDELNRFLSEIDQDNFRSLTTVVIWEKIEYVLSYIVKY